MTVRNLWAIPDIHGRYDLLRKLWVELDAFGLDLSQDKVIYLGDMIDRGFEVASVLQFIKGQTDRSPERIIALKGNHEDFLLTCYSSESTPSDWQLWLRETNGGKTSHSSLMTLPTEDRTELCQWIRKRPLKHEEEGFFFSHAPVPRDNRRPVYLREQPFTEEELIWSYCVDEPGWARDFKNGIVGVCGHVHALSKNIREPRFYHHYIYADAGCGCHPKAPLVAIEVRTRKVIFASEDATWVKSWGHL